MKLINITFAISPKNSEDFVAYIKSDFIPALTAAGYYTPLLCCVQNDGAEEAADTLSYALQMRAPNADVHARFMAEAAVEHFRTMAGKWNPDFALFMTELNVIYDGRSC